MFVGVLIGLAVSLGIAFYLNRTPIPFMSASPSRRRRTAPRPSRRRSPGCRRAGPAPAPRERHPEKPKFDFYKHPAGRGGAGDARRSCASASAQRGAKSAAGQQEASKDVYFIQAGSFQNPADADNQKARLAILGFESSVEPANLPDKGTWYRVRLGPYTKVEEINRVRQALAQNGIDASLVKVKDQQ